MSHLFAVLYLLASIFKQEVVMCGAGKPFKFSNLNSCRFRNQLFEKCDSNFTYHNFKRLLNFKISLFPR